MSNFLATDGNENPDFNQYWYSELTIKRMVEELTLLDGKVAFLSTPSVYFSVPQHIRDKSYVFDVNLTVSLITACVI